MNDEGIDGGGIPLGAALRGLPLDSPRSDTWLLVAARLPPPRRRARWPIALAAGLLGLMLLPRGGLPGHDPAIGAAGASVSAGSSGLAALMSESARLERLVAALGDQGASSATAATLSLDFDDRLRALDGALESNPTPARQLALWQQRVQLLRNVAAVEASRHYLASEGRSMDVALVTAY